MTRLLKAKVNLPVRKENSCKYFFFEVLHKTELNITVELMHKEVSIRKANLSGMLNITHIANWYWDLKIDFLIYI